MTSDVRTRTYVRTYLRIYAYTQTGRINHGPNFRRAYINR